MDAHATRARATLAAVAERAGVSRSTASLAFSGAGPVAPETRDRVLEAARTLGYGGPDPVARSLRRGRTGIVGVVIEDRLREAFRDPMNIPMLDGLADELGTAGLSILLLTDPTTAGSDPGVPAVIETAPMDAVVLVGCSTRLDASVALLRRRRIPIAAIEAEPMEGVLDIALDNRRASALGAARMHELGHRDIAVVTLPLGPEHSAGALAEDWEARATSFPAAERLRGVLDVYDTLRGWMAPASSIASGYTAGLSILADPQHRPTAVIAQSDLLALGVIRAADELGLMVPADLSVLGFDGIRTEGYGGVELTTLVQPAIEKGRAAGRGVLRLLAGEPAPPVLLRCTLRPGQTVGPPAA
ncbi:LacI family DNA-binding transcriptional regulator [Salinibacterium sp. SYSU T00001]|uniref:LacI family DNA-binding transcriptional regulator n=1 Tax=Homoserinimonas sedimenticola TaxID=2986805 RepID=UPI00223550E5|nr:LacI family DNA-binding transcriptional regulator [Salinibacterium sedimenticola]MCW4385842.1 LacI family DNA-binding transcriptional regulator [Salinibacterium sedimenticola]